MGGDSGIFLDLWRESSYSALHRWMFLPLVVSHGTPLSFRLRSERAQLGQWCVNNGVDLDEVLSLRHRCSLGIERGPRQPMQYSLSRCRDETLRPSFQLDCESELIKAFDPPNTLGLSGPE